MPKFLPTVGTSDDFCRAKAYSAETWRPAIRKVAEAHGLPVKIITRFALGENPVFALDRNYVVKLVPNIYSAVLATEKRCLAFLADHNDIPAAKLIGGGVLEDWTYLISSRLKGVSLSEIWVGLDHSSRQLVAINFGQLLASLHRVPVGGFSPAAAEWADFIHKQKVAWSQRADVAQLPKSLRETAAVFIERVDVLKDESPMVLLHGDLAPENMLTEKIGGVWRCSGVIDFGSAMVGHAVFDLTASTVLLARGDRTILERFAQGYGLTAESIGTLRPLLMAYTLLHPMAHLPSCLGLLPGLIEAASWDEVALRLWPDE